MRSLRRPFSWLTAAIVIGCSSEPARPFSTPDAATPTDGAISNDITSSDAPPIDAGPGCGDMDRDGISDAIEGRTEERDTDMDGRPDYLDTDSDNDGYFDQNEARRSYPGFASMAIDAPACRSPGDNCDFDQGDTVPNFRDVDSDNDGLTDHEELLARTNPCAADTDMDGVTDLIEAAAMSDGRDPVSRPAANSLYVVLPYHPADMPGPHEMREFTFSTRIRQADVFFLVDNSGSMSGTIANIRTNFSTMIVPMIQTAIPDVRFGVGSFDSLPIPPQGSPGRPGDYNLWVRQRLTTDITAAQMAFARMRTIDQDAPGFAGGDGPENSTEASYEIIAGTGNRGYENDPAALRTVLNALDPLGNGFCPRMVPERDCGADPDNPGGIYGWGCFREGRIPIVVLTSDAAWYDGCAAGSPRTSGTPNPAHNCDELVDAFNRRGAFFIGIDVGSNETANNARIVAMRTMTLNGMGQPIVFAGGGGSIAAVSTNIVNAIAEIAGRARQNITTRVQADAMAEGVVMGRTTADFLKSVVTLRGEPEAPEGYDRRDESTFYNVDPATRVTFNVDFYNDFQPGGATAKLYRATIQVIGRGDTVVDERPVYIVVPSANSQLVPQ
jgi:hypothetical protein